MKCRSDSDHIVEPFIKYILIALNSISFVKEILNFTLKHGGENCIATVTITVTLPLIGVLSQFKSITDSKNNFVWYDRSKTKCFVKLSARIYDRSFNSCPLPWPYRLRYQTLKFFSWSKKIFLVALKAFLVSINPVI